MNTKKYQLPKEFGEKWVKALRSGEYQQTAGKYIRTISQCYCAIGVAAAANNLKFEGEEVITGINNFISTSLESDVIDLNDDQNYDFNEIADWIEQNVNFI